MKIKILEEDKEKLKLEIDDLTFINLLNDRIWQQRGLDLASYAVEHPYLSKPVLIVRSKNPKKSMIDAAEQIIEEIKDLRKKLKK